MGTAPSTGQSTRQSSALCTAAACAGACATMDTVSVCPVRVGLVPGEEENVFCLEQPSMLRKLLEEHPRPEPNPTPPEHVQWACDVVVHLEELLGTIPYKHARGSASCRALKMITEQSSAHPSAAQAAQAGDAQIVRVVLIDRTADLLTPVLSQHSYGGLVDDLFVGDLNATRAM